MAEFTLQIKNSAGVIVSQTFVSGDTADEVVDSVIEEIESAQTGESDWLIGLEDEF